MLLLWPSLIASLLFLAVTDPAAHAAYNPVQCPISVSGAAGAPSCALVPGGQSCDPATHVFCQYMTGQPTTVDYCCSLHPADPSKPQRRACIHGCDAMHKADRGACTPGQGYKSCKLVAKARLNDCKAFCVF